MIVWPAGTKYKEPSSHLFKLSWYLVRWSNLGANYLNSFYQNCWIETASMRGNNESAFLIQMSISDSNLIAFAWCIVCNMQKWPAFKTNYMDFQRYTTSFDCLTCWYEEPSWHFKVSLSKKQMKSYNVHNFAINKLSKFIFVFYVKYMVEIYNQ